MSTALTFTRYCYRYPLSFCTFALPPVHCNYGRMGCERGDVRLIYTELRAAVRVTVLYNRCGCVYDIKDCVRSLQAQTTAVQNEWKERERIEGKNGDKRGPLFGVGLLCSCFSSHYSSSLPFSLFSLRTVWCVFATRTGWPICALSFSLFLLILLKETENDEQTVRCEGCIIVRIIRAAKKTGYQCQMIGSIVTAMAVLNSRIVPAPCSLLLLFVFLSLLPAFVTLVRSAHYCALRRRRQQL